MSSPPSSTQLSSYWGSISRYPVCVFQKVRSFKLFYKYIEILH